MNRAMMMVLLLVLAQYGASGQTPVGGPDAARRELLRGILKSQDLRHAGDSILRGALRDSDEKVRVRATIAFGSLQDTMALPGLLYNLVEGPPQVQEAAAFAIGQTAASLSPAALEAFEQDLIGVGLDRTAARSRMIGEIGKFGTEKGLALLLLHNGDLPVLEREALLMSIARFAIRKVRSREATAFAVERLLDPATSSWTAAYALQRIGDHETVRASLARLVPVTDHADPLIRMNLATLFGKIKDDTSLVAPLARLAGSDPDWRVRVNALRALGSFPPDARIISTLGSAISDENPSVVITALSVCGGFPPAGADGSEGLTVLKARLREMATGAGGGGRWQYRTEAALAFAKLEADLALPVLRIQPADKPLLKAGFLAAMGATGSTDALDEISRYLRDADPLLWRTALEALQSLAGRNASTTGFLDPVYAANIEALASGDMAVTTTAAANLGDSLFLRPESVPALSAALERLRSPAEIEAIQEVCRTLGKLGDNRAVVPLERLVASGDDASVRAAAAALATITGEPDATRQPPGREPAHTDFDFETLEALPETIRVALRTTVGEILMEWYRDAAPFTIMSMLKLAGGKGFYHDLVFHRVVPNFVVQGGDPRGDGWGGPGFSLRSEFSPLSYETGTVGIASAGKDTEGSQFFITHSPQPHLDGRYTIIGRVVIGMEIVDGIQVGDGIVDVSRRP